MADIFEQAKQAVGRMRVDAEHFARMASVQGAHPSSIAGFAVRRHLALLRFVLEFGHLGSFEEAAGWCKRVREMFPELEEETRRHLDRYSTHIPVTECEVCGARLDRMHNNHKCDPRIEGRKNATMRQERHTTRPGGRSESDRISEGFRILGEMGG